MKVIDLLNKIANGEEVPELIKYEDKRYFWTGLNYYNDRYDEYLDMHICIEDLEQYIEIIEEDKKIERLLLLKDLENHSILNNKEKAKIFDSIYYTNLYEIQNKINELIDEVNKLKDESK